MFISLFFFFLSFQKHAGWTYWIHEIAPREIFMNECGIPLRMCSFLVPSVPVESSRFTAAMNGQREETPKDVLIFLILFYEAPGPWRNVVSIQCVLYMVEMTILP